MTDSNGNETDTVYPSGAYTLTEKSANEDGTAPTGDNIITKFNVTEVTRYYDKTTGELLTNPTPEQIANSKAVVEKDATPVYYQVGLKTTEYGHKDNYDEVKSYTALGETINYYVDSSRLSERITANQNGVDIDKDFINKAIVNYYRSTIGDITGDFIANDGTAINNNGTIGNITGNFIGNSTIFYAGGAIHNYRSTIGDITGDFINNSAGEHGGAISNVGKTGDITGVSIGNKAKRVNAEQPISNVSTIGDITGDFIGNSAKHDGGGYL